MDDTIKFWLYEAERLLHIGKTAKAANAIRIALRCNPSPGVVKALQFTLGDLEGQR